MHAVVIYEPGGPEQLVYTEVPTPQVKPGWSLVRVRAFGLNHSEVFTRQGLSPSVSFPRILGIECVGQIADTTDPERLPYDATVVSIMGEMGRAFDGSYAEYALLPNEQIHPITTSLPWDTLAAIPETGYTAYGSLENLRCHDGETILVRGATSGVGAAFVKFARALFPNTHLAGTTRTTARAHVVKELGYDEVVVDSNGALQTNKKFNKALELIGPATLKDTCAHIKMGGIVCSTGQLGGIWTMDGFDPIEDLPANGYLTSFYSGNVTDEHLNAMFSLVEDENIDMQPQKVFLLSEVSQAHAWLETTKSFGKAVVVCD